MDEPQNEKLFKQLLLSEKWDLPNVPAPSWRYVIFSLPRTGSELLCARLRLLGLGVPCEYFNNQVMAERLGCIDANGGVDVARYLIQLEKVRTTPNGVFGTKLQPRQLVNLSGNDNGLALSILKRFDRLVLLRRRDLLLQAISMARSQLTGQWHVLKGDDVRSVPAEDPRLFSLIDAILKRMAISERLLAQVEREFDGQKCQSVFYEDLIEPGAIDSIIAWLAAGRDLTPPPPTDTPEFDLPRQGNSAEAEQIRNRYLASRGK